jgi:hypothetical protein
VLLERLLVIPYTQKRARFEICGTNPYVEHGRLVPDVVPSDHDKDINLLHVNFATPTPMREAILRMDTRGLL